jgi:hypothetical protein
MLTKIFNSMFRIIKKVRFNVFNDLNIDPKLSEKEISDELNSK